MSDTCVTYRGHARACNSNANLDLRVYVDIRMIGEIFHFDRNLLLRDECAMKKGRAGLSGP